MTTKEKKWKSIVCFKGFTKKGERLLLTCLDSGQSRPTKERQEIMCFTDPANDTKCWQVTNHVALGELLNLLMLQFSHQ